MMNNVLAFVVLVLGCVVAMLIGVKDKDAYMTPLPIELYAEDIRIGCERDPLCIYPYIRQNLTLGKLVGFERFLELAESNPEWLVLRIIKEKTGYRFRYLYGDTAADVLYFHDARLIHEVSPGHLWHKWSYFLDRDSRTFSWSSTPHYPRIWFYRILSIMLGLIVAACFYFWQPQQVVAEKADQT